MPAEWVPHRGTWLSWPHKEASWPGKFGPVPPIFARMVRHLADHEEVHLNVAGPGMEQEVRRLLADEGAGSGNVFFHSNPTNDAWCRDHGPIFVQRAGPHGPEQAVLDWKFNAWGDKYPPYDLDDVIPTRIAQEYGLPVFHPGIVLEGGSIEVNGKGTLLTTEACLLNPNRNPTLTREQIEGYLRAYLGVRHILWLGDGIVGDDTDGHIDDLTRFVDERTVVTVVEDDPADENYEPLQANLERLRSMRDQDGRALEVVTLPMPRALYHEGQRLPASYANFYIANGLVLLPTYDPERDDAARSTLQRCFPDREVIGIDCTDLVWGLGAFHCVSQQWPE
jgi:agmatine deiminase